MVSRDGARLRKHQHNLDPDTTQPQRSLPGVAAYPDPGRISVTGSPKTYVLDTSVLLSDPESLSRFDEHTVVLPIVVVAELEAKRHHPELGWAARTVLRTLEDLRVKHGSLLEPLPVNDLGGTVRVEMNHQDTTTIHPALRADNNDFRILVVAHNLKSDGLDVVVVTKDLPLRLRASVAGLGAEEYRHAQVPTDAWSGIEHVETTTDTINVLFSDKEVFADELGLSTHLTANTGLVLRHGSQSALARVLPGGMIRLIPDGHNAFDLRPRSAEQRIALDLLLDKDIGVVSLSGPAGTGKSVLSLAAALEAVVNQGTHRKIMVFKPLHAVGGEDLGYLPGTEAEKMSPWTGAIHDALEALCDQNVIDEIQARGLLEVQPVSYIRGRTLGPDVIVILSEAQNWETSTLVTALTRLGQGSRAFVDWDPGQRDNLRVSRGEGVVAMASRLRGNPLFGHVTLTRQERSPVAEMAATLLN